MIGRTVESSTWNNGAMEDRRAFRSRSEENEKRDDGTKEERDEEALPCMRKRRDLQLEAKRSLSRNSME